MVVAVVVVGVAWNLMMVGVESPWMAIQVAANRNH